MTDSAGFVLMFSQEWFGYECINGPCGTVLDVRLCTGSPVPNVRCPACGAAMTFKGRWPSTEGGYGSRGDQESITLASCTAEMDRLARELAEANDSLDAWSSEP